MGLKYNYKAGDKLQSSCGHTLEVIEVYSPNAIKVEDEMGRSKVISAYALFNNKFKWTYSDGKFCDNRNRRSKSIKIGDKFKSNNHGEFIVIAENKNKYTIEFLHTGYIKENCSVSTIYSGSIKDKSKRICYNIPKEFESGASFKTEKFGDIIVDAYIDSITIRCVWKDTGRNQTFKAVQLRNSSVLKDKARSSRDDYYVYSVSLDGEIIYIGKGTSDRYLHPNSGVSHVKEMNKLHFQGITFDVKVLKENLTEYEAEYEESQLIKNKTGLWNVAGNRK